MSHSALLCLLVFLLFTPPSFSTPPSPPKTQHVTADYRLKPPQKTTLPEAQSADLIDPRWQTAAKEWGAWAQVGFQTWGNKVGEWGQAGAERLKASELRKGLENLPGVWHASVAAVEKVLPEKGRAVEIWERVKNLEGVEGGKERGAVEEREGGEKEGREGQSEAGFVAGDGSKRDGKKTGVSKQGPAVEKAKEVCADLAPTGTRRSREGPQRVVAEKVAAEGLGSASETHAVSPESGFVSERNDGELLEAPEEEQTLRGKGVPPGSGLKARGIPPESPPLAEVAGVPLNPGSLNGGVGLENLKVRKEETASPAHRESKDVDELGVERLPAVRTIETQSAVDFEEWLQREESRKALLAESERAEAEGIPNQTSREGEVEREGLDVVVLIVGSLRLGTVFLVVRWLRRSLGLIEGRIDNSGYEGTADPLGFESGVLVEAEGLTDRANDGLERIREEYKDRLGRQLGTALGSATGSLLSEALRPLSDPSAPPLTPDALAQKLEAVCATALSSTVGDFPADGLIAELVRSFSQTFRTLTALHASTPGCSRPRTPRTFGRPDKPAGQSPRSPLEPNGHGKRDGSLFDRGRREGDLVSGSDSQREVSVTEEILRIGREYGETESSSEGQVVEERAEVSATGEYTVELEPAESGSPSTSRQEMLDELTEDFRSMGGGESTSSPALSAVSGGRESRGLAGVDQESDPSNGDSDGQQSPPPGAAPSIFSSRLADNGAESFSAGAGGRAESFGGAVEKAERWSFAGSTARHRKTRRRRGAENGAGRQLLFGGVSETSETGGVLAVRPEGGVRLQSAYVKRARSISVGSRSTEFDLAERSVAAQEQAVVNQLVANRLKLRELEMRNQQLGLTTEGLALKSEGLALKSEGLGLKSEGLGLTLESNSLGRQRNELEREKLREKFARHAEARAGAFARRCADELVAGLLVMVMALVWAGYRFGYPNLRARLQECRAVAHAAAPRSLWGRFGLQAVSDNLAGRMQVLACQIAVTGRLGMGLVVGGFMASLLLRQNVAGSVRVMPSTVLLLVLGVACGYAGKQAVDSVGGSGLCWLVLWETLCGLHTLALFPTGFLCSLLYPTADERRPRPLFVSPWVAQLTFHATAVVILPVAAGVLPFLWNQV